ncbi:FIST signal transduction protein [Moorella sulfitireducens]|uniref:FIST signal transduction protein n=1 Tax=Neomoorella sulfitireducens TaxID=2972948 RepID=UPI0021ABBDD7|nr:FIST N-terminal domain-containing protein [Moorella sulfitireducens]
MRVGIGFSSTGHTVVDGRVASEMAVQQSGKPVLTLLLTTTNYYLENVLTAVKEVIGSSKLIGACVPGIIANLELYERGVCVLTISGEGIDAVTHLEKDISRSSYRKGEEAGKALLQKAGESPGTLLLFPDTSTPNISGLLRGLYNVMGPAFEFVGGGSGSSLDFETAYQFTDAGISSDALAIAIIRGINFRMGLGHGWKPVGEPLVVTRAQGRRVYEIDGLPALERYSALIGLKDKNDERAFPYYSIKYPLGLPAAGGDFIIRYALKPGKDKSILFATEIPQNAVATIMHAETEDLVAAAAEITHEVLDTPEHPKLIIIFDCISRRLIMKESFSRELEAVGRNRKINVPVIGMLSFGEISSIAGVPLFYNKTIVVAAGW